MKEAIAERLIEEYGNPQNAADAAFQLARDNDWLDERRAAERFLKRKPAGAITVTNQAALDLIVAWHGAPIGNLTHDGFEWRWKASDPDGPPLVGQITPGRLPPFIEALVPEGWLNRVLNSPDERAELCIGKRYLSNITIVERVSELAALPADILLTRLNCFAANHLFTGNPAAQPTRWVATTGGNWDSCYGMDASLRTFRMKGQLKEEVMTFELLAIDLGKSSFHLHSIASDGTILSRKVSRSKLAEIVKAIAPKTVAMEACASAHHWGRQFKGDGREVLLINPRFVKPFVRGSKNDAVDAAAIYEAATRPTTRFVPLKSAAQQDLQSLHRIRERLIVQRTSLINHARGLLAEYGIVLPQGPWRFASQAPSAVKDAALSDLGRELGSGPINLD